MHEELVTEISIVRDFICDESNRHSHHFDEKNTASQMWVSFEHIFRELTFWNMTFEIFHQITFKNVNIFFLKLIKLNVSFHISVDKVAWEQLIGLFPLLVDCTTTTSIEVSRSLREALSQYGDLLRAPPAGHNEINGIAKS